MSVDKYNIKNNAAINEFDILFNYHSLLIIFFFMHTDIMEI